MDTIIDNDEQQAAELALKELINKLNPVDPTADLDKVPDMPDTKRQVVLMTELGNSRRLVNAVRGTALYVEAWGWVLWNGKFWEIDRTGAISRKAKEVIDALYEYAREKATDAASAEMNARRSPDNQSLQELAAKKKGEYEEAFRWAMASQTSQKVNSMINLAQSDLSAQVREFDVDPWLFNCQNGTVDLKTGELKEFDPGDRITRISPIPYDSRAACSTWVHCLNTWFAGDQDLIDYAQKLVGYSLSGLTSEQIFMFLYGAGRNGKSVFTNTIARVMGDYFRKAQSQTFMVKRNQGGASDGLAGLIGARFVSCSEMTSDQRFDENLLKDLAGGGDPITARHLYKSEFTFQPALKLWMYGNSKPQITGTDLGIWRRVRLIPFTVTIPESEVDPNLTDKLADELPGILAWAVRGCLKWQREGLKQPSAVKEATESYRSEEDILSEFISDCCETDQGKRASATQLYNAFVKWSGADWTPTKFGREMVKHGYAKEKTMGIIIYQGIGLTKEE